VRRSYSNKISSQKELVRIKVANSPVTIEHIGVTNRAQGVINKQRYIEEFDFSINES